MDVIRMAVARERGKEIMERWEREIEAIQRNIFLAARSVLLIESPHSEMLSYAISLLGAQYQPVSVTFEQAEEWLREREWQQTLPSIYLFDCTYESAELDHFLAQLGVSKRTLTPTPKALGMTYELFSLTHKHPAIDGMLQKPLKIKELRDWLL